MEHSPETYEAAVSWAAARELRRRPQAPRGPRGGEEEIAASSAGRPVRPRVLVVAHREGIRDLMGRHLSLPYCALAHFEAITFDRDFALALPDGGSESSGAAATAAAAALEQQPGSEVAVAAPLAGFGTPPRSPAAARLACPGPPTALAGTFPSFSDLGFDVVEDDGSDSDSNFCDSAGCANRTPAFSFYLRLLVEPEEGAPVE